MILLCYPFPSPFLLESAEVCPSSLRGNWLEEASRWLPSSVLPDPDWRTGWMSFSSDRWLVKGDYPKTVQWISGWWTVKIDHEFIQKKNHCISMFCCRKIIIMKCLVHMQRFASSLKLWRWVSTWRASWKVKPTMSTSPMHLEFGHKRWKNPRNPSGFCRINLGINC